MHYDLEYADNIGNISVIHNMLEEFTEFDFGTEQLFVTDQRGYS